MFDSVMALYNDKSKTIRLEILFLMSFSLFSWFFIAEEFFIKSKLLAIPATLSLMIFALGIYKISHKTKIIQISMLMLFVLIPFELILMIIYG